LYKTAVALVMVAALILAPALPAYASSHIQHTFALRSWIPGPFFQNGPPPGVTDPASGLSLSYRADWKPPSHVFLSVNYSSLSVTPTSAPWNGVSFFDVNAHYRFGTDLINRYFGIFAGYGSVSVASTIASQVGRGAGFRFGAEFLLRQPVPCPCWVFTGSAAWGPSWSTSFAAFPMLAAGRTTDYRLAIGRELANGFGFELGWRSYTWMIPTSPGCSAPGCEWRWNGFTLGIFVRR
jgi:hypothetical protein